MILSHRQADILKKFKPQPHTKEDRVRLEDLRHGHDEGRRVIYIPGHANGDWYHPDSKQGRISSWNHKYVFVDFGNGDTHPACSPSDLIWAFDYQ